MSLARAAYKFALSHIRALGGAATHPEWPRRAETCERCPMRVVQCGVSYCGKPFLSLPVRDQTIDGCGCPVRAKAKDPRECCPVTRSFSPAVRVGGSCDCKWCALAATN